MSAQGGTRPEAALAEGFARHVERWALEAGAAPASARATAAAAGQLSLATSAGHVCVPLGSLDDAPGGPRDAAQWRALLRASGVVAGAASPGALPLVVDDDDRLYLQRYFDYERRLARRLMRACAPLTPPGDAARLRQRLEALFPGEHGPDPGVDWQKLAVALALNRRLTVISGGPGTGKTTTVVALLACLIGDDPSCRIALAAPTGKAAARLTDAIRQRASHLGEDVRARLPAESFTVHRLLGVSRGARGFVHHAGHPLAIDALVVDEASMLDLALATQLLEAVPDTARIVLLGDKDQLAAVEAGAVFSELGVDPSLSPTCAQALADLTGIAAQRISPPPPRAPSVLRDSVVWLERNYRFSPDSGIGALARRVNAGDADGALAWLRAGADADVRWIADDAAVPGADTLQAVADGYAPYAEALGRDGADHDAIAAAFARFRVLCALRDGPRGADAVNAEFGRRFRRALGPLDADAASHWYPGRPVLVLRNDYQLGLFNGDIGITLPAPSGALMVHFPDPAGGWRAVAPLRLPPHETAFAMTVHKAQGSEFDSVLVLLPERRSRVLSRELLYTALTRARRRALLCGGAAVLAAAIGTPTRRRSGLPARLREAAADPPPTP